MNNNSRTYGYARVSSKEQNEERQIQALVDSGVEERFIFIDKQSGKDFDRPKYKEMISVLQQGDTIFVLSIDRLGRNYNMIIEEWRNITKNIKADIRVLDMPILDTSKNKELLGTVITDIVLGLLSYVAEQERAFINQRQREGCGHRQGFVGFPPQHRPLLMDTHQGFGRNGTGLPLHEWHPHNRRPQQHFRLQQQLWRGACLL